MKYYTAFVYKNHDPKELHCTHKYLGALDADQATLVISMVDGWFKRTLLNSFPRVAFTEVDLFGPKKDIRVLKPKEGNGGLSVFDSLRGALDLFRPDDFPKWNAHVSTTDLNSVHIPFFSYALLDNDGTVIREWFPSEAKRVRPMNLARITLTEVGIDLYKTLRDLETDLILQALEKTVGDIKKAAGLLTLNRTTLQEKIKRLGLRKEP